MVGNNPILRHPMHMVKLRPAVWLTVFALLSACSEKRPAEFLASARLHLANGEAQAAYIDVKNILQLNPDAAEGRYLLGLLLLNDENPRAAEAELRKAQGLGYPAEQITPPLMRALVAQRQFKTALDEINRVAATLKLAQSKADIYTSLATAQAGLGDPRAADESIVSALSADPNFAPALLLSARRKIFTKDNDGAFAIIESILSRSPKDQEAWKLKGDFLKYIQRDDTAAIIAYEAAVKSKPNFLRARWSLSQALMDAGRFDECAKQLALAEQVSPNNLQTKYIRAKLLYLKENYSGAREIAQQLLKIASEDVRVLQLAGALEMYFASYAQGESLLQRALQIEPYLPVSRRLLAGRYLQLGEVERALAVLSPLLTADNPPDAETMTTAGHVYLQAGRLKLAEEYFSKASALDPKDARKRTSLAVTHMLGGNVDAAQNELQSISSTDKSAVADLALITTYFVRKDYPGALNAVAVLEKKQPNLPLAANLRGRIELARKDFPAARRHFEEAVKLDPINFPAIDSLVALDLREAKYAQAITRYKNVLEKDPRNSHVQIRLAEVMQRAGAPRDDVASILTEAISSDPLDPQPRVLLVNLLLRGNDKDRALQVAQEASAALPSSTEVLEALGIAQGNSGDFNQAVATFRKLATLSPKSPKAHLLMADLYATNGNKMEVERHLKRALEINPSAADIMIQLALFYADNARHAEAISAAKKLQESFPKQSAGYLLEGDLQARRTAWELVVAAYLNGLQKAPSPELAIKLHTAYLYAKRGKEADSFGETWIKDHPSDVRFWVHLGDRALAANDLERAESLFKSALQQQNESAIANNNLAWVELKLHREGALAHAETAVRVAPRVPEYMDTLAEILAERQDYTRAAQWQEKALALQPKNPYLKLNLVKILLKQGGQQARAKTLLDELAAVGKSFSAQTEVETLRTALQKPVR